MLDISTANGAAEDAPRMSAWSEQFAEQRITNERLGHIAQLLGELARHPYTPTALPRPQTASERLRRRREVERYERAAQALFADREE